MSVEEVLKVIPDYVHVVLIDVPHDNAEVAIYNGKDSIGHEFDKYTVGSITPEDRDQLRIYCIQ